MTESQSVGTSTLRASDTQFTIYRPKVVTPGRWYELLAFAHAADKPIDAPACDPNPIEQVHEQAQRVLGAMSPQYAPVAPDDAYAVPSGSELIFVPNVPGVEFNPPRRVFTLHETVHREEFRLRASESLDGQTARGKLSVYLGAVLLADVGLAIKVDRRHAPQRTEESLESESARPYRRVFASYSHKDAWVVEQFEQLARATGDEFLRDCSQLRAGEIWNERLLQLIEGADVFQLFWSTNAMRSEFVRREWEHALALNRPNFIRPTYWEQPLPEDKSTGLPPESLRMLHFQSLTIAEAGTKVAHKELAETPTGSFLPQVPKRPDTEPAIHLKGTDPDIFLPASKHDTVEFHVSSLPPKSSAPKSTGQFQRPTGEMDFDNDCRPASAPPNLPHTTTNPRSQSSLRTLTLSLVIGVLLAVGIFGYWLAGIIRRAM